MAGVKGSVCRFRRLAQWPERGQLTFSRLVKPGLIHCLRPSADIIVEINGAVSERAEYGREPAPGAECESEPQQRRQQPTDG